MVQEVIRKVQLQRILICYKLATLATLASEAVPFTPKKELVARVLYIAK